MSFSHIFLGKFYTTMCYFGFLILFVGIRFSYDVDAALTVSTHFSEPIGARLYSVYLEGLKSNDIQTLYYSATNVPRPPKDAQEYLCKTLLTAYKEAKYIDYEKNFYLIGTHANAKCTSLKLPENIIKKVKDSFNKDALTVQEIFYNMFSYKILGEKWDTATSERIAKNIQALLKKDDSLSNLAYSFFVATELGPAGTFIIDRVEDAIAQADEVDGRMLQFEGGLSITGLVIAGVFKVATVYDRPPPLTDVQAMKFAQYFLSRRSVQTARGVHILVEAMMALAAADRAIAPICIQLDGTGQIEAESPILGIEIISILGKYLNMQLRSVTGKIVAKKGNTVLAEKVQFTPRDSSRSIFITDLSAFKPTRGIYTIDINAEEYTQTLTFKVLGKVKVHSFEVGVGDSDATSAIKKQNVAFPNTLPDLLIADHTQKLTLKAVLTDDGTTKVMTVHQAFVRLARKESTEEIIYMTEQDSSKAYKFDMDVGAKAGDFNYRSGVYELEFIVGDSSISNSFKWHVANVQLKFPSEPMKETESPKPQAPRPEIDHQFRTPDKRPPRLVSDIFTVLCLIPLAVLFILWAKLGINVSNFTFSVSTIGFHIGFGAILGLFGLFWLKLNMFQTIRILIPLATITFLCGNRLLRRIAGQKAAQSDTGASQRNK